MVDSSPPTAGPKIMPIPIAHYQSHCLASFSRLVESPTYAMAVGMVAQNRMPPAI